MTVKLIMVLIVLARAVYTDLATGKIENKLLLASVIPGIALDYYMGGVSLVFMGLKMAVIMIGALFILFILKGLGAGDIKLLSVIGIFLPEQVVSITVAAFIIAGVLSVLRMLLRAVKKEQVFVKGETMHFSLSILFGVCVVAVMTTGLG